ncbi:hypothetical protein SDC9_74988 [bioreactor metagenome]|uniref:Uncharacterized protein n=1 Tax=bioreactor metagenome TaxID=1076179 RepID=A0A644YIK2_9ZZZZ
MQLLAVPHNGKRIAADAATRRLDHGQRYRSRDGCIHRIAAREQHAQPRLCGQRLRRAHHIAAQHGGTVRRVRQRPIFDGGRHIGSFVSRE